MDSFMLSFNKHLSSTYYMPSIILGMEDTVITQKKAFILLELLFMVRESDNKQNTIMYLGWVCWWWPDILPCSDSCVGPTAGYRIHFERGSLTRWRWCWLLAGSSARVGSWRSTFFSMRAAFFMASWASSQYGSWVKHGHLTRTRWKCVIRWWCSRSFYELVSPPAQSHACSDSRGGNRNLISWWKEYRRKDIELRALGMKDIVSTIFGKYKLFHKMRTICNSVSGNNWIPGKPGHFPCTGNVLRLSGMGLLWTAPNVLGA